jgi:hypothetical protein
LQQFVHFFAFLHLRLQFFCGDCLFDRTFLDARCALLVAVDWLQVILLLVFCPTTVLLEAQLLLAVHAFFHWVTVGLMKLIKEGWYKKVWIWYFKRVS